MIISEARYAAATVLTEGGAHKFDDIGEMVVYHMDHPDQLVRAWFVHDYRTETWLRGETAYYVMAPEVSSPMGIGVVAFAKLTEAQAFASERETTVLTFDELRAAVHMVAH
jgi:nitrous oxide reductase accessory protein NosL